jgi:diguanylate cyclase (GGDEF)-like protein
MSSMPEYKNQKNEFHWENEFRSFLNMGSDASQEIATRDGVKILSVLLDGMPTGVMTLDAEGTVTLLNNAAREMLKPAGDVAPGTRWDSVVSSGKVRDHSGGYISREADPLSVAINHLRHSSGELILKSSNPDSENWLHIAARPVIGEDGSVIATVALLNDISDYKGMQETLYFRATHDHLTRLSNRLLFSVSLGKAFARSKRDNSGGALLIIGVDKFKRVNESLGYAAGDELLRKLAVRVCSEVRETDMISRIGGDEFCALISDISNEDDPSVIGDVADRICRSVSNVFDIEGNEVYVTVSIGISLFPPDATDEETLFAKADAAMRVMKEGGRNGWKFWSEPERRSE